MFFSKKHTELPLNGRKYTKEIMINHKLKGTRMAKNGED